MTETAQTGKVEHTSASDKKPSTGMAVVAYLIFFVPLLTDAKDDPFVKFHVKQSLGLIVFYIACAIVSVVPILGWIIGGLGYLVGFVLWIIGIVNAASGKKAVLPIIGNLADEKLKF